jgi:hypothetical protein
MGESCAMGIARLAGIVLIVGGAVALAYGGFTYTSETHSAKLGPVVVKIQERQTVDVPIAVGGGAIALGVLLLLAFRSR